MQEMPHQVSYLINGIACLFTFVIVSRRSLTIMSEKYVQVCGMCIPVVGETTKDPQQFPGVVEVRQ